MKASVITSVYNNKQHIETAITSVLEQSYSDIEYIIIDGASTDGTLEIIEKYKDDISLIISEPDKGIYDGLNKGIANATGDFITFIHSDDMFYDENVIKSAVEAFKKSETDSVYGDLLYTNETLNRTIRYWKSGNCSRLKLSTGWMPPHPAWFVKRKCYQRFGNFNNRLKIAADYDLILRFLYKEGVSSSYVPKPFVKMRLGGASNKLKNSLKKYKEDLFAARQNKVPFPNLALACKKLFKVKQFFYN